MSPFPYQTIADVWRHNARQHRMRALYHSSNGFPSYAEGSIRKAERAERRAADIELYKLPPGLEALGDMIASSILLGPIYECDHRKSADQFPGPQIAPSLSQGEFSPMAPDCLNPTIADAAILFDVEHPSLLK